ncbi:molybdopterin molybdotransferase MoeA [Altibacter sp. HG106]|uniref:molybdopterin molybdotransferase MoeA n=1 Tax=Altibacter sp. HG106 TaxID=3023937 RepID=UPI002350F38F|nr:gephyrin-like molybdotransferase Glp [Altibacter sp. HG106]MDC7995331.1 molybdopterin molybdotransferase MoeA [Altibacter sp. HG106]
MISVAEALQKIKDTVQAFSETEVISVAEASQRVLATHIVAPLSLPPFPQSSMDGYAVCGIDRTEFQVIGEIQTGDAAHYELNPGEAVRIFTGAQVPGTAEAVIMQEKVSVANSTLRISERQKHHQNIRPIGQQIQQGERCLEHGHTLNPSTIALLHSLGITEVSVAKQPRVAVLVTGNELISPGVPLRSGQVYESNSALLTTALQQLGLQPVSVAHVQDTLEATTKAIHNALKQSDVLLVSGGISMGDYDFVGTALAKLGVTEVFYKVKQKPGKPLYFGTKEKKYVFALPGNPASSLSCFYNYVWPALQQWQGATRIGLPRVQLPVTEAIENPFGRALFLKALVHNEGVTILDRQHSSMILSFAHANALVYVPEDTTRITKGSMVTTLLLPNLTY